MGDLTKGTTAIANLPLQDEEEAAYAAYVGDMLKRVMVINMHEYNYTTNSSAAPSPRPSQTYTFNVPQGCSGFGVVQRLMANGSDATSGATWNGISYNHELKNGMPVTMGNTTRNEMVEVNGGVVTLDVPWSSAAMVNLQCCKRAYERMRHGYARPRKAWSDHDDDSCDPSGLSKSFGRALLRRYVPQSPRFPAPHGGLVRLERWLVVEAARLLRQQ
ncbi:hypothetical protein LTR04_007358 [Oleoguttula sp. CCFEE 6159]|nr:hypothetical protein LTR04_007358 [Oleoguttula sp. CCFEE 6159]